MFFSKDSTIKVIDWQWASVGNPIVDVSRFLIQSLNENIRQKNLRYLFKYYKKIFE